MASVFESSAVPCYRCSQYARMAMVIEGGCWSKTIRLTVADSVGAEAGKRTILGPR
jgi:hypothetical protein